jgi:hypothetical protein
LKINRAGFLLWGEANVDLAPAPSLLLAPLRHPDGLRKCLLIRGKPEVTGWSSGRRLT